MRHVVIDEEWLERAEEHCRRGIGAVEPAQFGERHLRLPAARETAFQFGAQAASCLRRQRHQIGAQTQRVFVTRHTPPRYQPRQG